MVSQVSKTRPGVPVRRIGWEEKTEVEVRVPMSQHQGHGYPYCIAGSRMASRLLWFWSWGFWGDRRLRVCFGVYVVVVLTGVTLDGSVSGFDAAFGGYAGVLLAVAGFQGFLVLGYGFVALTGEIEHAAKIDVGPGEEARILAGGDGGFEAACGFFWILVDEGYACEDEVGAG